MKIMDLKTNCMNAFEKKKNVFDGMALCNFMCLVKCVS